MARSRSGREEEPLESWTRTGWGPGAHCVGMKWNVSRGTGSLFRMLNIYLIKPNFNWRSQRVWISSPTNPAWREQGRGGESCFQSENCRRDVNAGHGSVQVSAHHLVRGDLASHQAGQTEVLLGFQMLKQFYHLTWVQSHGMILHSITWNDTFKWNKIVSMPVFLHFNCFPLASEVLFCNFVGVVASVHRSFHQPGRSLSLSSFK